MDNLGGQGSWDKNQLGRQPGGEFCMITCGSELDWLNAMGTQEVAIESACIKRFGEQPPLQAKCISKPLVHAIFISPGIDQYLLSVLLQSHS